MINVIKIVVDIQLLESPIPAPTNTTSSGDISGTKRGIIDPLVSKRPEKILNKKFKNKNYVKNGQKWQKWSKINQNGSKWSKMV